MYMTQGKPAANISFPDEEEKILKYWKEIDAFRTSLKQSAGKPRYTFYDGPPFPTGLPHYGHILGGTVKDVVTRWAHQTGFHVERRFGWDCHGLPVEYEIDKSLGLKGPEDVQKLGIKAYNDECRKVVMRYSTEWQEIVTRLGRWIDFENDYKTMYPSFIESIWWVTKELHKKGLLYKDTKVVPYSTACNTPLSNFEAVQNCKVVEDPSVIVTFPLLDDPNVAMVAWTASPWTLPSNLSLCVNPNMNYVKIKDNSTGKVYIMMEARLEALFKKDNEYTVLKKYEGRALEGIRYDPIFPYFKYMREKTGAFRVLLDEQVSAQSGTGVVPQSPYFQEDDYHVCLRYGVITKDMKIICPVDATGKFTDEVEDFKGQYVKNADKCIIQYLREKGRLVHQTTFKHKYPFCWRSETPLIYKAVPSWFVRVEQATTQLLENNQKTYWVPDFVKEKKFANWLREPQDWVVSRNRYWGTPIPIWISEDGEEIVCVGSIEELKQLSGVEVTDLHREFLDNVTIPSKLGKGVLRRTPEVFDCWFDIGCVPYAHIHYPFERKSDFDDSFPADIIAEGLDQTRGWFYTLLVLSTLLFGKPAFKNVIVNGIVLAEDGNKMSKRLKNYPDPMLIVHKYGADALRFYLCNSPALKAEGLRFKEKGVDGVVKRVFLPWYNAYRFFMQNVDKYQTEHGLIFLVSENKITKRANYTDRWILSLTQSLIKFVRNEMKAYRLYTLMPTLVKFIKQLTNWYIRMNRRRLKGENGLDDCRMALETLFSVLMTMSRLLAPMIPYITEYMFQGLRKWIDPESVETQDIRSVHFLMIPSYREDLIDTAAERSVFHMQSVIELGRIIRTRNKLPLKYPLKEVVVIHSDPEIVKDIQSLKSYIVKELNVQTVKISENKSDYGAHLVARTDFKSLGARMKEAVKTIDKTVQKLTDAELEDFQSNGKIAVAGHVLGQRDIKIMYKCDRAKVKNSFDANWKKEILVLMDIVPDQSMLDEGVAKKVINLVQKLRKKGQSGDVTPSDQITVYYKASGDLQRIIQEFSDFISNAMGHQILPFPVPPLQKVFLQKAMKVKKEKLEIAILKQKAIVSPCNNLSFLNQTQANGTPFHTIINGVLVGMPQQKGEEGNEAINCSFG